MYSKVTDNDIVYYVRSDLMGEFIGRYKNRPIQMTTLSDFVINKKTNEIIKNRNSVENILDTFTGNINDSR